MKEIKLNLGTIVNMNTALKAIIEDKDNSINWKCKYKLLGIMKAIEPVITNYEIVRNDRIREYGTQNEEGNWQIDKDDTDNIANFSKALQEILGYEETINIEAISAKEIMCEGMKTEYLMALYPIIEQ